MICDIEVSEWQFKILFGHLLSQRYIAILRLVCDGGHGVRYWKYLTVIWGGRWQEMQCTECTMTSAASKEYVGDFNLIKYMQGVRLLLS